jgi:hypothetical protein
MWRWILLVVAIVGLSAAIPFVLNGLPEESDTSGVPFPSPEVNAGPIGKLLIEGEPQFDLGKTAVHKKGKHEFAVKNVGDGPLSVKPKSTTCQCTVLEFDPKYEGKSEIVLQPGESTNLTVEWIPKSAGKFEQTVIVQTSDPAQPEVGFMVRGMVYPPLVTMPEQPAFDLPRVLNDEETQIRLAISSLDEPDFKIVEIRSTNPELLTATQSPLTDEEKRELKFPTGYKLDITLHPSVDLGGFAEMLIIKTDHSGENELQVPVRGRRQGAISAVPENLTFPATQTKGGRGESFLLVRGQETTTFEVEKTPPGLQIQIEPVSDAQAGDKVRKYRVVSTVPVGEPADMIEGEVVLKTNHPTVAVLRIPVRIPVTGGN